MVESIKRGAETPSSGQLQRLRRSQEGAGLKPEPPEVQIAALSRKKETQEVDSQKLVQEISQGIEAAQHPEMPVTRHAQHPGDAT